MSNRPLTIEAGSAFFGCLHFFQSRTWWGLDIDGTFVLACQACATEAMAAIDEGKPVCVVARSYTAVSGISFKPVVAQ